MMEFHSLIFSLIEGDKGYVHLGQLPKRVEQNNSNYHEKCKN